MDDLTPVKGPPTPFEGRSAKVLALVVIGVLVALIKPWGSGPGPVAAPVSIATATPGPVESTPTPTPFKPFANYDHEIFGIYEPDPVWELWPAGYLVSFGYAIRIESLVPGQTPAPAPGPSGSTLPPTASGAPSSASPMSTPGPSEALPTGAPADGEPFWPATIRITDGNHLGLIGVNMPLGYRVTGIGVFRTTDGANDALDVITPASDWPSHFTIVALADETRSEPIERWPPGEYRLELKFEPGAIERTVMIEIDPPRSGAPDPDASASPAPR